MDNNNANNGTSSENAENKQSAFQIAVSVAHAADNKVCDLLLLLFCSYIIMI